MSFLYNICIDMIISVSCIDMSFFVLIFVLVLVLVPSVMFRLVSCIPIRVPARLGRSVPGSFPIYSSNVKLLSGPDSVNACWMFITSLVTS